MTDASEAEDGPTVAELLPRLEQLTVYDREQLGRRLERVRTTREPAKRAQALHGMLGAFEQAERRVEQRRAAVPEITYPEELPVSQLKDEIAEAELSGSSSTVFVHHAPATLAPMLEAL